LRILRLIDNFSLKNAGVWKVATATCGQWGEDGIYFSSRGELPVALKDKVEFFIPDWEEQSWDVIESHGVWQWNTKAAHQYANMNNIPWVAVPHGMLEPWSLQQKRLKKWAYLNLVESPLLKKASIIKAVSLPEAENLKKRFGARVHHLYNPVDLPNSHDKVNDGNALVQFVFLGRLHHKKNPLLLLQSWIQSGLYAKHNVKLLYAGPDDGAAEELNEMIQARGVKNVQWLGPVYGDAKDDLMRQSSIFVLPSSSEGLPSTAVEAMAYNMQCVLSTECNFEEAFAFESVLECALNVDAVSDKLLKALQQVTEGVETKNAHTFVEENFSISSVLEKELELYHKLENRS
jgi:glycosyltransferase involved in cell wall biosynthesis